MIVPADWDVAALFGDALVAGVLLALMLPVVGAVTLLRGQVFLTLGVAQASAFGVALASRVHPQHEHGDGADLVSIALSTIFGVGASAAGMLASARRRAGQDVMLAWMYLAAGSGALLLLADAPHGHAAIQRVFLSSLLAAQSFHVWGAAAGLLLTLAVLAARGRRMVASALDPITARVHDGSGIGHELMVGGWAGTVCALALATSGMMFTFAMALLPTLAARRLTRSLVATMVLAPVLGAVAFLASFAVAVAADLPPAQCTVAGLALLVAAVEGLRLTRRRLNRSVGPGSRPTRWPP